MVTCGREVMYKDCVLNIGDVNGYIKMYAIKIIIHGWF